MLKTATDLRPGDWVTPIGEQYPSEAYRVTRCSPYDCPFTDRRRYGYVRVWFGAGPDAKRTEFRADSDVWVFD